MGTCWTDFLFSRGVPAAAAAAAAAAALLVEGVMLPLLRDEKRPLVRAGRLAPLDLTTSSASSTGTNLHSQLFLSDKDFNQICSQSG